MGRLIALQTQRTWALPPLFRMRQGGRRTRRPCGCRTKSICEQAHCPARKLIQRANSRIRLLLSYPTRLTLMFRVRLLQPRSMPAQSTLPAKVQRALRRPSGQADSLISMVIYSQSLVTTQIHHPTRLRLPLMLTSTCRPLMFVRFLHFRTRTRAQLSTMTMATNFLSPVCTQSLRWTSLTPSPWRRRRCSLLARSHRHKFISLTFLKLLQILMKSRIILMALTMTLRSTSPSRMTSLTMAMMPAS